MVLFIDTETYSEVPITVGTYRYAEAAEVMLFAWAIDDEPVEVWDVTAGGPMPAKLEAAWLDERVKVACHNVAFDRTVLSLSPLWGHGCPALERWHCTMAQALAHGLPGALGTLGTIFGLADDEQKSKKGKQLVQLFCKERPKHVKLRRATRETHPEEWAEFVAYAGLDVVAMRQLYRKLPRWNYEGAELELWRLDQRINARGFAVDRDLARAALRATDAAKAKLDARTAEITDSGVRSAMQRDALLRYVLEEHGVELPDLQASTLERRVDDETLPAPVRELLAIRLQSSGTSIRKYQRLLGATSSDGRLRGTLLWNGASRTGRWSGRVFQPQNLPRTPEWFNAEEQERAVEAMKLGVEDLLYA